MKAVSQLNFEYTAGSIDSLLRFVKANEASTLLPYLSTIDFSEKEKIYLRPFTIPVPYRSIGLVVHRHFVKKKLVEILRTEIIYSISKHLPQTKIDGDMLYPI